MKVHRFILPVDPKKSEHLIEEPEFVRQVGTVLKLTKGEQIIVATGVGSESICQIGHVSKDAVGLVGCEPHKNNTESHERVVLYLAILKKDNFELAVQKAVEVGVAEIVPLLSERTVKLGFVRERLEKIAKEAAEQSGRSVLPEIHDPLLLRDALFGAKRRGVVLFCDTALDAQPFASLRPSGERHLFIGPEGGWSDAERDAAREFGAEFVRIAPTTLRAETAAIVASYLFSSYSLNQ